MLAQIATDATSNEITAVPKLLAMLTLTGTIVTADALNCQRAIAQQIVDQGGDYVLALKGNQGTLHDDVSLYLDDPVQEAATPAVQTVDADHGRIETRTALVSTEIDWLQQDHRWPGRHRQGLHWRLDVVMNEDQDRTRMDNGPQNLAVLRHMALNVMQKDGSKEALRGKFQRAGWDNAYLSRLLALF